MTDFTQNRDNAAVLQGCLLFEGLAHRDLEALGRRASRQDFRVDETLFHFGDPGESMMVILQGSIRILRPMGADQEMILGDLVQGDILGEMALLDGKPRSAEARAITNGKMLVLARRDLLPFLETHPQVALSLLAVLCEKVRRADQRTSEIFSGLPTRIAKTLLRLAEKGPKLGHSQQTIADMVGCRRESVNRQINAWHDEGLVEKKGRWIIVADTLGERYGEQI